MPTGNRGYIYLVWEMGMELEPSIIAFTNKSDFDQWIETCKDTGEWLDKKEKRNGSDDDFMYRFGYFVIPWARTKAKLCENIRSSCHALVASQHHLMRLNEEPPSPTFAEMVANAVLNARTNPTKGGE